MRVSSYQLISFVEQLGSRSGSTVVRAMVVTLLTMPTTTPTTRMVMTMPIMTTTIMTTTQTDAPLVTCVVVRSVPWIYVVIFLTTETPISFTCGTFLMSTI